MPQTNDGCETEVENEDKSRREIEQLSHLTRLCTKQSKSESPAFQSSNKATAQKHENAGKQTLNFLMHTYTSVCRGRG